MCGIVGIIGEHIETPDIIAAMCKSVRHRGPDGYGNDFLTDGRPNKTLLSEKWDVGLGHQRLAIIDLSCKAKQPMWDADHVRPTILTYNGEVYNFRELRATLENLGHTFTSQSDTEVVLQAYKEWGIDCVSRFNGMFAFAIWDSPNQRMVLARDRYGIKPLYYHFDEHSLIFGSEVKAILAAGFPVSVNLPALSEYFTFQNLLTDQTLFDGINMLPPGTIMEIDCRGETLTKKLTRYWQYSRKETSIAEGDAVNRLRDLFVQAVERQLVSDVPIGSYLSGGMDTGSISSVTRTKLDRISTFTCGFDMHSVSGLELGYDERGYAEFLANLIKSEHYEAVLHAGDMEAVMSDLVWHVEDLRVGQCYPDWYASKLASKFVKVVLSGTGGDELFGGYPWRYFPGGDQADGESYVKAYYNYWQRLIPDQDREWFFNYDVFSRVRDCSSFEIFKTAFGELPEALATREDRMKAALVFELKTFLHGLFVVTDKVSMAHSLETRVPFMDNDLVDFALSLPVKYCLKSLDSKSVDENDIAKPRSYFKKTNEGKHILRLAMRGILPQEVLEREKQGFSAPDGTWFRGESVDYVRGLLLDHKARICEYVNRPYVQRKLDEHASGKKNNRLLIWSLLCFEHWLRRFMP